MNIFIKQLSARLAGGLGKAGLFSPAALGVQVACVTLLLQTISFVTTWQGAGVYLGGVFPLAPFLFALAVQSTVWFFANALRAPTTPLRLAALGVAVACSTIFSYVGVYGYVQPPQRALQARYAQLYTRLNSEYTAYAATARDEFADAINRLATALQGELTALATRQADLDACRAAYDAAGGESDGAGSGPAAPTRWQYANYADYLAAYSAYQANVSQHTGTQTEAARQAALAQYGFATVEDLTAAQTQNATKQGALAALLGAEGEAAADAAPATADAATGSATSAATLLEGVRAAVLAEAASESEAGLSGTARGQAARLVAACNAAGVGADAAGNTPTTNTLFAKLDALPGTANTPLLPEEEALEAALPGGRATADNATALRSEMEGALGHALATLATVSGDNTRYAADAAPWQLPQIYLLPITALVTGGGQGNAWFCLGIAALVDGLTLLFALSGRRPGSLLAARRVATLFAGQGRAFTAQATACLPGQAPPTAELDAFLALFHTDESAMAMGYSLAAPLSALAGWDRLVALLCQCNLASIRPGAPSATALPTGPGAVYSSGAALLLKTRFLLWANEQTATRHSPPASRVNGGFNATAGREGYPS
ncbi:MAG: hypothetical protein PHO10_00200 [Gemmiger sp.]|nr:hypothetical protein [Gemmiger sp.]